MSQFRSRCSAFSDIWQESCSGWVVHQAYSKMSYEINLQFWKKKSLTAAELDKIVFDDSARNWIEGNINDVSMKLWKIIYNYIFNTKSFYHLILESSLHIILYKKIYVLYYSNAAKLLNSGQLGIIVVYSIWSSRVVFKKKISGW